MRNNIVCHVYGHQYKLMLTINESETKAFEKCMVCGEEKLPIFVITPDGFLINADRIEYGEGTLKSPVDKIGR